MIGYITNNRRQDNAHDWRTPYTPQCIVSRCSNKPYWDGEVHYSCCLSCLKEKSLGPFRVRAHKEDYSTLFWLSDWETKERKNYEQTKI